MILCRIILFASISMPFFPLHGEVASVGNGIHTKDEEALRLISVIDNQKVDFYKDGTRIILAERLSQLNLKDDLRSFVGKDPASGRFTVSWFKETSSLSIFCSARKAAMIAKRLRALFDGY